MKRTNLLTQMGRSILVFTLCVSMLSFHAAEVLAQEQGNLTAVDQNLVDADKKAADNANHDAEAAAEGKPNKTNCSKMSDVADENFDSMIAFEEGFQAQQLDELQRLRDQQDSLMGQLGAATGTALTDAETAGELDGALSIEAAKELQAKSEMWKARAAAAKIKRDKAKADTITWERRYQVLRAKCNGIRVYTCTSADVDARDAAYAKWQQAVRDYERYRREYRYAVNQHKRVGSALSSTANQEATGGATDDMKDNDAMMAQSHAISGISDSGELTGPLQQNDEAIVSLYNSTTASAERMAEIQERKLYQAELRSQHNADYRLYEMALDTFDTNKDLPYLTKNASGFHAHASAMKNLEVMAFAGAAVKNFRCTKHRDSEVDSKSYHLFKAASATYLMAEINDTAYYSDTAECRAYEDFTTDDKDLQVRSVERAVNMYDEAFEAVCLKIDPTDPALKKECDEHVEQIIGHSGFKDEDGEIIRSREVALMMYENALDAAMSELQDKSKKVMTAVQNVKKGEEWIKSTRNKILQTIAIYTIQKILKYYNITLCSACGPWCGGCCAGCPQWPIWKVLEYASYAYWMWLIWDLAQAIKYTRNWKRKRYHARHFTHLVCNQGEAFAEENQILNKSVEAKQSVQDQQDARREEVLQMLQSKVQSDPMKYNYDPMIMKSLIARLEKTKSRADASIIALDITRHLDGEIKSLPYDAELPNEFEVSEKLAELGLKVKAKLLTGANIFVDLIVAPAQAEYEQPDTFDGTGAKVAKDDLLAAGLGVKYGGESFAFFLTTRNEAWQDLALDVTSSNIRVSSPVPYMETESGMVPLDNLSEKDKTGFPLPDTRIITIQNMITRVNESMAMMNMALEEIAAQRSKYVMLLEKMKQNFKLDQIGMDETEEQTVTQVKGQCMTLDGNGGFTQDPECKCRESGACANFIFPTLGALSGASGSSNLVTDTANSLTSGDLNGAGVGAGGLAKNALRTKNNILKSTKDLEKNGGKSFRDLAAAQRQASQQNTYEKYKNRNPLTASMEKGGSLFNFKRSTRYTGIRDESGKNGKKDSNANTKIASSSLMKGGKGLKGNKGKSDKSNKPQGINIDFDYDDSDLDSGMLGPDGLPLGGSGIGDGSGKKGKNGEELYGANGRRNGHKRSMRKRKDFTQVNKNRQLSIFRIISSRYKKTAYPIIFEKQAL